MSSPAPPPSASRRSPSRSSRSTTVRCRPAKPHHRTPPPSRGTVPSRRTLRVPGAHPPAPATRPAAESSAAACASRLSVTDSVGVGATGAGRFREAKVPPPHCTHTRPSTQPGRPSSTTRRRRPRRSHPPHATHAPVTCVGSGQQHGQPHFPCRVAGPTSPARRSASRRRRQPSSCPPATPSALPCRACTTALTRCASSAMRPTGSSSRRSSRALCTPDFSTARYVSVSHGCPRRPTKVWSTTCSPDSPEAKWE